MSAATRPPSTAWRLLRTGLLAVLLLAALAAGVLAWWVQRPLPLAQPVVELTVAPGMSPREVARAWVQAGVQWPETLLYGWFRFSGDARRIRAGSYALEQGATVHMLLAKMVAGDEQLERVRLIEGWTFRQWRAALAKAERLRPTTAGLDEAALMAALGRPGQAAEGRFLPDTYLYSRGVSDLSVLKQAADAMDRQLAQVWAARRDALPLASPEQALVLASLVEKETGLASDRAQIAGVFINRLRIGMPLQTDPSVIYGLGEAFDGNLRRSHLQADTPFNTYTRRGLPPTPIAMPGLAALRAAVQPQDTRALYFVARGDGSSVFSDDLAAHNRAVNQYQRMATPASPATPAPSTSPASPSPAAAPRAASTR